MKTLLVRDGWFSGSKIVPPGESGEDQGGGKRVMEFYRFCVWRKWTKFR